MGNVIEVDIKKKFSNDTSLEVDFKAPQGLTVLFGRSGAGKSVTLQCIAGLMEPNEGKIYVNNSPFFDSEKKVNLKPQQRNIGYVFQSYALFPHLNVFDNVAIGVNGKSQEAKQQVLNILDEIGIEKLADMYPGKLSGGEQQRVAIARALARKPQILLLDEPFSALDAPVKDRLRRQLKTIQKQRNLPIIFITHQPYEAFVLADSIVVLDGGRVEQTGTVDDIFYTPKTLSIARLVGAKNIFQGTIHSITNNAIFIKTFDFLIQSDLKAGFSVGEKVNWCIRPENIMILREDKPLAAKVKENVIVGTIDEIESRGPTWSLYFSGEKIQLKIDVPAHAASYLELSEGKKMSVSLKKQSIHLIK